MCYTNTTKNNFGGNIMTAKEAEIVEKKTTKHKTKIKTKTTQQKAEFFDFFDPRAFFAELVGTFLLASVATMAILNGAGAILAPLYVGLTLAAIVLMIGGVSGAHVNPAVSFGMFVAGKLSLKQMVAYWVAQCTGAMIALMTMLTIAGKSLNIDFGASFLSIERDTFLIEVIAAAIFVFGVVAITSNKKLSSGAQAIGVGVSIMITLLIAGSFYTAISTNPEYAKKFEADQNEETKQTELKKAPRSAYTQSVALNPAIALISTEATDVEILSKLSGRPTADTADERNSRFGQESIIGSLLGAAIGAIAASTLRRKQ